MTLLQHCKVRLSVDDTMIYVSEESYKDMINTVNDD